MGGAKVTNPKGVLGSHPNLRRALAAARRVGPTRRAVLIRGESGTGKERLARLVHETSGRRGGFVAINCATLVESLLESELFGHERGAFTGASGQKKGLFEAAHRGTLFLDEIGDLPISLQAGLLRVLQEGKVRRVGGTGGVLLAWTVRLLHRGTRTQTWSRVQAAWLAKPDLSDGRWLTGAASAELFRLLWRNRRRQNLQIPPHRRADASGFSLDGLREQATRLAPEALRTVADFDANTHDFEIVPIAALTIEPRKDVVASEVEDVDPADEAFEILDTAHRPAPDFLERVLGAVGDEPLGVARDGASADRTSGHQRSTCVAFPAVNDRSRPIEVDRG